jgi:hypothetical protein
MFERTRVAESKRASDCPLAERVRMCSLFSERSRAKYFLVLLLTPDVKENCLILLVAENPRITLRCTHCALHCLYAGLERTNPRDSFLDFLPLVRNKLTLFVKASALSGI